MAIKYLDAKRIRGSSTGSPVEVIAAPSGYTTLKFVGSGTFTPASGNTIHWVVVGGGAGGGVDGYSGGSRGAGGGGAGAYRESGLNSESTFTSAATEYTIIVGAGGAGGTDGSGTAVRGSDGSLSSIAGSGLTTITSNGGGAGGGHNGSNYAGIANGNASGGGGANEAAGGAGGTYGNAGGAASNNQTPWSGSGGGGASAVGETGVDGNGGDGGAGRTPAAAYFTSSILAGGGAGRGGTTDGDGGSGIGGDASAEGYAGGAGTNSTGSGGGATRLSTGGVGGKGVVLISFLNNVSYTTTETGSGFTDEKAALVRSTTGDGTTTGAIRVADTHSSGQGNNLGGAYAYSFDGSNDYVRHADDTFDFDKDDEFSISWWFKSPANEFKTWASNLQGGTGATARGWWIRCNNGTRDIEFVLSSNWDNNKIKCGFSDNDSNSTVNIYDGNWHHVVITYDGSEDASGCTFYLDNVAKVNSIADDTLTGATLGGGDMVLATREFNSTLDDFMLVTMDQWLIYDKELSSDDVTALWGGGNGIATPSSTNLVCWYNFEQATTDTLENQISQTKIAENTLFEETDTFKTYWLQSDVWRPRTPTYTGDMSTGWVGSSGFTNGFTIDTANNEIDFLDTYASDGVGATKSLTLNLGAIETVSTTAWCLRFDYRTDGQASGDNPVWWVGLADEATVLSDATDIDYLGFGSQTYNGSTNLRPHLYGCSQSHLDQADLNPRLQLNSSDINLVSDNTKYYIQVVRDGSNYTVSAYSDSSFSTLLGNKTAAVGSQGDGLAYLVVANYKQGSNVTGAVGAFQFWNGVTEP